MSKLLIFVFSTLGSYLGWELGSYVGLMTAFCVGSLGAVVGIVVGWKLAAVLRC